jgi:hypothetical protein
MSTLFHLGYTVDMNLVPVESGRADELLHLEGDPLIQPNGVARVELLLLSHVENSETPRGVRHGDDHVLRADEDGLELVVAVVGGWGRRASQKGLPVSGGPYRSKV